MKHIEIALEKMGIDPEYLSLVESNKIIARIQDGPYFEIGGQNGIQVTDLLIMCLEIYRSMNEEFPCRENSLTMTKIEEAILWQHARTADRERRGVEGKNES